MSDHKAAPKNEGPHLGYTDTLRNYIIVIIYLFNVEMLPFYSTSLSKQEHCHACGLRFARSPILYRECYTSERANQGFHASCQLLKP